MNTKQFDRMWAFRLKIRRIINKKFSSFVNPVCQCWWRFACKTTRWPVSTITISFTIQVTTLSFLALFGLFFSAVSEANTDILVLLSHDSPPYQQTLEGFKAGLAGKGINADYEVHIVSNDLEADKLWSSVKNHPPKLILALGTPATHAALLKEHDIPVISGLILDTDELKKNSNATGVSLHFATNLEWLWLRRLLPSAQQIVLIYDPRHGTSLLQSIQRLAQIDNVNIIPAPASNPDDVASLIQNLPSQLDAIWAIDAAGAFNPIAVRELLLYSFRNRIPLIGLSGQWVKAGAFYALDWDFIDLGTQTAELAWSIVQKGDAPSSLPPQSSRKVRPVLNSKTAEHMKLAIPEQWLPEIGEVFQ